MIIELRKSALSLSCKEYAYLPRPAHLNGNSCKNLDEKLSSKTYGVDGRDGLGDRRG